MEIFIDTNIERKVKLFLSFIFLKKRSRSYIITTQNIERNTILYALDFLSSRQTYSSNSNLLVSIIIKKSNIFFQTKTG